MTVKRPLYIRTNLYIYYLLPICLWPRKWPQLYCFFQDEATSVISFTSSVHSLNNEPNRGEIDTKIECVDSLVALLGQNSSNDLDKMSQKFLAMSSSPANCDLMRSHRVVQYLVQILHGKFLARINKWK